MHTPMKPGERRLALALVLALISGFVALTVMLTHDGDQPNHINSGAAQIDTSSTSTSSTTTVRPTSTTARPATATAPPASASQPPAQPVNNATPTPAQQDNVEQAQPTPAPPPPPAAPQCPPIPSSPSEAGSLNSGDIYTEHCGLSFTPNSDCYEARVVIWLRNPKGFKPGQTYYTTVWDDKGRHYPLDLGNTNKVNADGTLPWRWTCEAKDQPVDEDEVTFVVMLTVPETGQWIAFEIIIARAPV